MKEPDTAYSNSFTRYGLLFCFQLGNTPSCWLFSFGSLYWIYDLYLSYITRLGWRSSDCQTERICYHKAYVDSPAHRLLGGRYSWSRTTMWKLWTPVTWWRGSGRGGAHKMQTWMRGTFFALLCFFPARRRSWFLLGGYFMENNGYSN